VRPPSPAERLGIGLHRPRFGVRAYAREPVPNAWACSNAHRPQNLRFAAPNSRIAVQREREPLGKDRQIHALHGTRCSCAHRFSDHGVRHLAMRRPRPGWRQTAALLRMPGKGPPEAARQEFAKELHGGRRISSRRHLARVAGRTSTIDPDIDRRNGRRSQERIQNDDFTADFTNSRRILNHHS
jgi:hypothetical protein